MVKRLLIICILFLLLIGCTNNDPTYQTSKKDDLELTKLKSDVPVEQQPANQAKEFLSHFEEVSAVRAVNHDNELVIAVDINHHDRFQLDHLENELTKDVKQNFSKMNITFSTDKKILIELKKLEEDIQANKVSGEDIKERLSEIKKLSKEET